MATALAYSTLTPGKDIAAGRSRGMIQGPCIRVSSGGKFAYDLRRRRSQPCRALCSSRRDNPRRHAQGDCRQRQKADPGRDRCGIRPRHGGLCHSRARRHRQPPALRTAAGILRPFFGAAEKILQLLLSHRARKPGRSGKPRACRNTRPCRRDGWGGNTGTGLRLGFTVAHAGGKISLRAHHRGLQFPAAAPYHRGPGTCARACKSPGHHHRHERLRRRQKLRSGGVGGDVRAYGQLVALAGPSQNLAQARVGCSSTSSPIVTGPHATTGAIRKTGWAGIFSPAASCPRSA